MADQRCPMCGKRNPPEADTCSTCGARLKPLQVSKPSTSPAPATPSGEGSNDWMSDLRGDMMRNRPKTSMLPPEPPAPEPSDGWLSKIRSQEKEQPSHPAPPPEPKPSQEVPPWLSKVRAQTQAAPPKPEPTPPPKAETALPPEGGKAEEEPVWLKRLRVRHTQEELSSPPPAPVQSEAKPSAATDLPDWLSRIRDRTTEESGQVYSEDKSFLSSPMSAPAPGSRSIPPSFPEAPPAAGPSSPWGGKESRPISRPTDSPAQKSESVPDWLKPPADAAAAPSVPEIPDWLSPFAQPAAAQSASLPQPQRPAPSSPPTQKLTARGEVNPPTVPRQFVPPSPSTPALGPEWEFPSEMPVDSSFLTSGSEIEFPGSAAAFNLGTEPMVSPGGDEGIPDWLADAKHGTAAAPTPPPEIIEPAVPIPDIGELLRPDSMPDWLRKPAETELKTTPEDLPIPKAAATENLEQAELPRWLEAMRPIQSVAVATEDEERVESVGPLAGLRGVLSAEPVVAMPHRPGIMAGNIDTTPGQVAMADMLRRLVIEPEVRAARRAARSLSATPLIRRAMAAVLLLAVFFPLYGGALFSQPGFLPSASLTAGAIVNNLPADRPVLAAFEYDASTASELESGAIALLAHISSRGVPIAIISTQPNGINLAEGLFVYSGVPAGILPTHEKIFNLGYLPGGAAGLRALASNLRGAVNVPESWWSQAPLSSILSVGDFSMVLVIASRPQTVRDWVEQVHTAAPNTPMVAVVSAASDALVYPYTQGSKPSILGMVAGYAGAQAYHNMFLQGAASPPGAEARWQAFGMGSLVSILLLAAGMIGSLVAGRIRKTRKAGE